MNSDDGVLVEEPSAGEPFEQDDEPGGYRLTLPSFRGPLDLLLHLIKKHEIDIYDIPIVLVTEQYNEYLDTMEQLDLEIAADYVYMAAVLIHIKSKMLLPRDLDSSSDAEDPRAELVKRLLEYERFKAVAESFAEIDVVRMGIWTRHAVIPVAEDEPEIDLGEVSLFDLVDAFRRSLERYKRDHPQAIELRRIVHKVSVKMREMVEALAEKSPIRLLWYLEGRDRGELISVFLGMLELVRLGAISLRQESQFAEILTYRTELAVDSSAFAIYDS